MIKPAIKNLKIIIMERKFMKNCLIIMEITFKLEIKII